MVRIYDVMRNTNIVKICIAIIKIIKYHNIMKKFILIFLILLFSCANNSYLKEDNYFYNNIEGIDYVLIQYDPNTDEWIDFAFREGIPVELTSDELDKINEFLHEIVYKYNTETKTSWGSAVNPIDLSKYNRQYIAIINENEEMEVFINCFWSSSIRLVRQHEKDVIYYKHGKGKKIQSKQHRGCI